MEIVTPARKLLSEEVEEVTAPGELGEFGVLAGHTPYLTTLKAGAVSYKSGGGRIERIAVGSGYAEVSSEGTTILVDHAEQASEVDIEAAKEALAKADEELKGLGPEDPGYKASKEARDLAEARIKVKEAAGG